MTKQKEKNNKSYVVNRRENKPHNSPFPFTLSHLSQDSAILHQQEQNTSKKKKTLQFSFFSCRFSLSAAPRIPVKQPPLQSRQATHAVNAAARIAKLQNGLLCMENLPSLRHVQFRSPFVSLPLWFIFSFFSSSFLFFSEPGSRVGAKERPCRQEMRKEKRKKKRKEEKRNDKSDRLWLK
ncbi:hypothetical protein GGI35DRAFT_205946 [Trichoderma velutinum]